MSIKFRDGAVHLFDPGLLETALERCRNEQIEKLYINGRGRPVDLDRFTDDTKLTHLTFDSAKLGSIEPLKHLRYLIGFGLVNCSIREEVSFEDWESTLLQLTLSPWKHVASLAPCTHLESLYISGYRTGKNLEDVGVQSARLKSLTLVNCRFSNFEHLSSCAGLRDLTLNRCPEVDSLAGFGAFHKSLASCVFETKTKVVDYDLLSGCSRLQLLILGGDCQIDNIAFLSGLRQLQRLVIMGRINDSDLKPLLSLTELEHLYVRGSALYKPPIKEIRDQLGFPD